jgi:hypothetical protein
MPRADSSSHRGFFVVEYVADEAGRMQLSLRPDRCPVAVGKGLMDHLSPVG